MQRFSWFLDVLKSEKSVAYLQHLCLQNISDISGLVLACKSPVCVSVEKHPRELCRLTSWCPCHLHQPMVGFPRRLGAEEGPSSPRAHGYCVRVWSQFCFWPTWTFPTSMSSVLLELKAAWTDLEIGIYFLPGSWDLSNCVEAGGGKLFGICQH